MAFAGPFRTTIKKRYFQKLRTCILIDLALMDSSVDFTGFEKLRFSFRILRVSDFIFFIDIPDPHVSIF